ncbi:hypothetical protein OROGR_004089 [Orobanche gracilis]
MWKPVTQVNREIWFTISGGGKGGLRNAMPKTPAVHNVNAVSKTICVGNMTFDAQESDVENVFKDCGEIVHIHMFKMCDGESKGVAHVRFATVEAALKADKYHRTEILQRPIRVELYETEEEAQMASSYYNAGFAARSYLFD